MAYVLYIGGRHIQRAAGKQNIEYSRQSIQDDQNEQDSGLGLSVQHLEDIPGFVSARGILAIDGLGLSLLIYIQV
jgi:hypothetical protein